MLKLKTTILTNEKTNEANYMHDTKMKTFIISKFLSSNKAQIEKFNYFSTNSIAVNVLNERKFTFKSSLKLSKVINLRNNRQKRQR